MDLPTLDRSRGLASPRGEPCRRQVRLFLLPAGLLVTVITLSLTGCLVPLATGEPGELAPAGYAPVPERDEAVPPETPETPKSVTSREASAPTLPDLTTSLDLRQLQALALARHPRLEAAAARVEAATRLRSAAAGAFFPVVGAEATYLRLEDPIESEIPPLGTVVFQDDETVTLRTRLRYSLHDWGRRQDLHQARGHELEGEKARRLRLEQAVSLGVAAAYFRCLELVEEIEVVRASRDAVRAALQIAEDSFEVDRVTRADVLVFRARLRRVEFQLKSTESQLEEARENLNYWLDLPATTRLELESPGDPPDLETSLDVLVRRGLERRQELVALSRAREALREQADALATTYLPELFLFVEHQYSDPATALSEESLLSGGLGVSWELFDGGIRYQESRALRARQRELESTWRDRQARVTEEIRQAHRAWQLSEEALAVATSVLEPAEENLERVTDLFQLGRATGQEVLEAEALLGAERAEQARALYRRHLSYHALRHALGLDLDEPLLPASTEENSTP